MHKHIAIAGIHTDIGKTIASAVLAEALDADYWKPVQAGGLDNTDSNIVRSLITNGAARVHPEAVRLTQPMSPHAAAAIDDVVIDHTTFTFPATDKTLLVETAGGLLSPLYGSATMAEFIEYYKLPAILVSNNYLGSINHTLLTIEVMQKRNIPIAALVLCGRENKDSEEYISAYSGIPVTARIPFFEQLNSAAIKECAIAIKDKLLRELEHEHT
ncbi:MAG: dethiobiotin synthase [Bacteroidetes bacterium 46-16]|nr:MAG: dethiobiotin synthase [Bacteroidetes bacterium 46-16]